MTETEKKLRDAATQMRLALADAGNIEVVRSCVNAFLSHARSVTMVMEAESAGNAHLLRWYKDYVKAKTDCPVARFFVAKRNHSIHRASVPLQDKNFTILNLKVNGVSVPGVGVGTGLYFDGVEDHIPGDNGNVFRLCEQYFLLLKEIVEAWLAKRAELGIR